MCLAHLLRDAGYLIETESEEFGVGFRKLLVKVFDLRREMKERNEVCEQKQTAELEKELNQLLAIPINGEGSPETAKFRRSMLKYRNCILECLYDLEVPPDNNGSERAIRNVKVKQKISGQFNGGQQTFCVLRSVIDTLIKRQPGVLFHLSQIMTIQPE